MCLYFSAQKNCITYWIKSNLTNHNKDTEMYKHKAIMTERRHQILILIAKGYNNKQIAKKMGLTLCHTKLQKWRLYCYLGDVHSAIDAVYMGLQMGLISKEILSEPIREEIYGDDIKQTTQVFSNPERERLKLVYIQDKQTSVRYPEKIFRAV